MRDFGVIFCYKREFACGIAALVPSPSLPAIASTTPEISAPQGLNLRLQRCGRTSIRVPLFLSASSPISRCIFFALSKHH